MIVILVPELEALLREAEQVPGRVRRILACGKRRNLDIAHHQSVLMTGQALPPAPLTRLADRPDDSVGAWMRADPVRLVPDLNAVWMQPGAQLDSASAAAHELKRLFDENDLQFDMPAPGRGYLRLKQAPASQFVPPWAVAGHSLDHVLPTGDDARRWRKLLNEAQMLLHQHLDVEHPSTRQPGGLWFWGAGELPSRESVSRRVSSVTASDEVLTALSQWLSMTPVPLAMDRAPPSGTLVEWPIEPGLSAAENLATLDRWLKPLWRRLKSGRLPALELASPERAWMVRPMDAWRFWRRGAESQK